MNPLSKMLENGIQCILSYIQFYNKSFSLFPDTFTGLDSASLYNIAIIFWICSVWFFFSIYLILDCTFLLLYISLVYILVRIGCDFVPFPVVANVANAIVSSNHRTYDR